MVGKNASSMNSDRSERHRLHILRTKRKTDQIGIPERRQTTGREVQLRGKWIAKIALSFDFAGSDGPGMRCEATTLVQG